MFRKPFITALALCCSAALIAGEPGVVLYERTDFQGESELIYEDVANMRATRLGNDALCSIRIPRGCEVILYEHAGFGGRAATLRHSEPDLGRTAVGLAAVSSIRVLWLDDYQEQYDYPQGVTLFSEPDFRGEYALYDGAVANLGRTPIGNDRVAAVAVPPGYTVTLFEHKNFRGRSVTLHRDEPDLGVTALGRWRASSIQVFYEGAPTGPPAVIEPAVDYWEPAVHVGVHLVDDDAEDVLAVAAGALLVAGVINAAKKRNRVPGPGVTLYQGPNFAGDRQTFRRHVKRFRKTRLGNDLASSIDIPTGYEVVLYEHDRFRGRSVVLNQSVADLSHTELGDNSVSSMIIRYVGH